MIIVRKSPQWPGGKLIWCWDILYNGMRGKEWWEKGEDSRDQWGCLAELAVSSAVSGKDEGRVKDTSSFQFVYWVNGGAVCWNGECCQAEDGMSGWVGGTCGISWGWGGGCQVVCWSGDQKREREVCASNRVSGWSGFLNSHVFRSLQMASHGCSRPVGELQVETMANKQVYSLPERAPLTQL